MEIETQNIFTIRRRSGKTKKKRIDGIQSRTNDWITDPGKVKCFLMNYFSNLFSTSNPSECSINNGNGIDVRTTEVMQRQLDASYKAEEINKTLFRMDPWKVPGSDEFHSDFF